MDIQKFFHSFFKNAPGVELRLPEVRDSSRLRSTASLLNTSFLVCLQGTYHPDFAKAQEILNRVFPDTQLADLSLFYRNSISLMEKELKDLIASDSEFRNRFHTVEDNLSCTESTQGVVQAGPDMFWPVFFPEGTGIFEDFEKRKKQLRKLRSVKILTENPSPVVDPGKEILFTSNILLTLPPEETDYNTLDLPEPIRRKLERIKEEEQLFFYDHPVQIGVHPEANEILYGLTGLNNTCKWEKLNGNMEKTGKLTCLLSVSVTHKGLHTIAKEYIRHEMNKYGSFENLDVYIFTEEDTQEIIKRVLLPLNKDFCFKSETEAAEILEKIFGVDGEYGRHYSFLKAVAAFWHVFIDREKRATFKIDLDQVFPEKELKNQTGKSAFEHFKTPLWGARGTDTEGNTIELGMIAGALVNEKDIHSGIFTPDVRFDDNRNLSMEERVFHSRLMMGFSTEAELMTRYGENDIDGRKVCIQRIHVTGGTNGILIEYLRKYRPFTPSFIGRAEDQCYILSVLTKQEEKIAYLHEDGLIMRHDKEAFASEAIKAASFGSTIGDYIRILYFSKYVEVLTGGNIMDIKKIIDPFTGCFVSKIPLTLVYLRFALTAREIFGKLGDKSGNIFLSMGVKRITETVNFTNGKNSLLASQLKTEKEGWNLFYNLMDRFENSTLESDSRNEKTKAAARIAENCRI